MMIEGQLPAEIVPDLLEPCVRCLSEHHFRQRCGIGKTHCIIQCSVCEFNVTKPTWKEAQDTWNGFRVWELVRRLRGAASQVKPLLSVLLAVVFLGGCSDEKTTTDAEMWLELIFCSVMVGSFFGSMGYDMGRDKCRELAVKAGVGYWTVDECGCTEFHFGIRPVEEKVIRGGN